MPEAPQSRTIDVDAGQVRADGNTLRGHAAVFDVLSEDLGGYKERIAPGAFSSVLDADVRLLVNHKPDHVLARTKSGTLRLTQDDTGLLVEADLPDTSYARDLRESVKRGDVDGMSFRFTIDRETWDGDVRTVESVKALEDVCLATFPAYPSTSVEMRARTLEPRRGGGLRVEDRAGPARDVDTALRDAIRDVRAGESRALTTAVSVSPGELSTHLFDKLRSTSVVLGSGAVQILTTQADSVTYPTVTVDTAPTNYSEGATITPGDPTLATVVATPKKIAHLVQLSNEVIDDSDPSIIQVVSDNLLKATAVKLDQQLIEGSGTPPQLTGMHLAAGVQTMASAAIMANFDWASDALALLEAVGGKPAAWFMASRTRAQIRKLHETTTSVKPVMDPQGPAGASPTTLFGVPIFHSNQASITDAPGTATAVHLVAEGALIYVNRQSPVIEVDRSRLFNSDQSEIRCKLRGDLIVAIPNGVVRVTGMLPG
ncbi:MAG: HK97 family phage prohead protease [Actinomycetota bacterium]|nr:HK97 family phage prohead protease [Actinomycetota bacterium]